jgi:hypothetical protein
MTDLLTLFDEAQAALEVDASPELNREGDPAGACSACGGFQFWQIPGKTWHCRACHPMGVEARRAATTLTLPGAKPAGTIVALDEARIMRALKRACEGLLLSPEELRAQLDESDLAEVMSGALSPKALRLTAKTISLMGQLGRYD